MNPTFFFPLLFLLPFWEGGTGVLAFTFSVKIILSVIIFLFSVFFKCRFLVS